MDECLLDPLPDAAGTALYLDFDGTLVEIAPRPDAVEPQPGMVGTLDALAAQMGGALAIVSGRNIDDLERFLPGFGGTLVGSHGAERRIDGTRETIDIPDPAAFEAARNELRAQFGDGGGVLLEEKPVALVLHYRAAPEREEECRKVLSALSRRLAGFTTHPSKMAVELMPGAVSKGHAVRALHADWAGRTPVAIGDDRTDEDMFEVAAAHGGFGIKVGPGETSARHRLADVAAVHALLGRWSNRAGKSS